MYGTGLGVFWVERAGVGGECSEFEWQSGQFPG